MNRILLALLLACGSTTALAQRLPPDPSQDASAAEATGAIAGIVVSAKTGEPLRSARVMLRAAARRARGVLAPGSNVAISGADGRFSFAEVPPGEYMLFGSKAGYGMHRTFDVDSHFRLGPRQTRDDIVLRLRPSAVVTGRVLDAYGEPLPGASVSVMWRSYMAGETRWRAMQTDSTNDLGEYRLRGLGPGRYVVVAESPREISPRGVSYREFAASFYPSGDSPEQATAIRLTWGDELAGIDFRLDPAPETIVQGMLLDGSTGDPCESCSVFVQTDSGLRGFSVVPTREGVFVLHGLPPGPSWVVARARGPGPRQVAEEVLVPATGTTDVDLILGDGQTVSAEVVLEDPPQQEEPAPEEGRRRGRAQGGMFVNLVGRGPAMWGARPRANVPSGGGPVEFEDVSPGTYWVQTRAQNGGYLRAISLDGHMLDRPEIRVSRDVPLSGLRLHIAFDGASIDGVIQYGSDKEFPARVTVALLPEPGSTPFTEREFIGVTQESFRREGIPPGRYTLLALPRENTFDLDDPEVRRSLQPFAQRITLAKGETATVELTYVPEPQ